MGIDLLIVMGITLFLLFLWYWWVVYTLVDKVFESPRFKKSHKLLVGVVNTAIIGAFSMMISGSITPYVVLLLLMLLEFGLFYKDALVRNMFCTSACIIHVLAIRAIVVGTFSMVTGYSVFEISNNAFWLAVSTMVILGMLNIAVVGVLKFIPLIQVRIINQHKEPQWFLVIWMTVNNIYLLYNANVFHQPQTHPNLSGNQIIAPLTILLGLYIVLFFAIKTVTLLGYKEKNVALEQAFNQEQQYRNAIAKDAVMSYEVNVTQDRVVRGFGGLREEYGDMVDSYSDMMAFMTRKMIHSDDIAEFIRFASIQNIMKEFTQGKSELTVEYRRLSETGEYIWVRAMINLVKMIDTDDLVAFVCIKDIDTEKQHQLDLQRKAERDPLTGLYNKEITGKLVNEHLTSGLSHSESSALFMIDVDNFKDINDHFGHVFGDAVLCELADKLHNIFRSDDIVGRIGGDEYIAYMKNGTLPHIIKEKAKSICKAFYITYKGLGGEEYTITGSVGIAIFPRGGANFEELYKNADVALYMAKSKGKNNYQLYDGSDFAGYKSSRTEIHVDGAVSQKSFRQNRIEYVFKMLYQSDNSVSAIHSALELVTSHFSFDRGYIFETSKDGRTTSNTFEWCADGVGAEINNLQNIPIEAVQTANEHFKKTGTFVLQSIEGLPQAERAVLEPQGIKSMFQFGIFDKNNLLGFIGFDNCQSETVLSDTDIDEIATICNILATFFVKQHIDEASVQDLRSRQEVMNHLDNYIYVVNMETFEVLFMNEQTRKLMNEEGSGTACYEFLRGRQEQCSECPMRQLQNSDDHRASCELYNEKLGIWMETTASALRWTDGSFACLVNGADITKQKEAHLSHIYQLEQLAYVDELTGSPTYNKFKEDAQLILERQQDISHLLVKFDIDNFKLINQIYGYEKGDEVLCCVAKALQKTLRNQNEIFARVANDEFVALFTLQDDAMVTRLYKNFLHHFYVLTGSNFTFKCDFPQGRYIVHPGDMKKRDIKDMFEKVNVAHKAAKQDKTLDFVVYDESMTQEALRTKEIENKMTNALANDEFAVYLQPKYYLDTEKVGGAEALVRWRNENTHLFPPNSFIPVFEKNGFITKLDFYVLHEVCAVIRGWMDKGIEPVAVSVNFSRLHLSNRNFVRDLCKVVDGVGVEREYIEIEITETDIYDNIDTFEDLLCELHAEGFTISMDDFGSGYSSLGMLKNLRVDVIKMDRSFFVEQRDIERSRVVVGSVIQMAATLGIRIVAEGVEKKEHIDFLRELHCDMVQGYYYTRPMPVENFTELIYSTLAPGVVG